MENFQEIVGLLGKQDKGALQKLYEQYGKKFYSYCIVKWHLAEDDAWEIVYRTLETLVLKAGNYSFATQADFDRFVYKILINFLRQHYRTSQALKEKEIEYVSLDGTGTEETFSGYIDEASIRAYFQTDTVDSPELIRLKLALEQLDEEDRDLLLLRAQNFSYGEIGKLLNAEDEQLKVKHHRAKKKLVAVLTMLQTTNYEK